MNKRFVMKLAVTVATMGVVTLLQGCYQEEDDLVLRMA
jgi:low affinity Fe/Cu permease